MEIDQAAKRLLEDYADSVARRSGLPDRERLDARLELYSHLFDVASTRVSAEGGSIITQDHARLAIHSLGTPDEVDAAFFAPKRAKLERAPFTPRAIAYLIDFVIVAIATGLVVRPLVSIILDPVGYSCSIDPFQFRCSAGTPILGAFRGADELFGILYFALIFAAFEATRGQTPGKIVMQLRTATEHGGPVGWKAAFIRNFTKGFPPLVLADTLLGHFAFGDKKERVSDRYAGTVVVREVR
ncbi:MAG: RDD family protein [Euryarchaeota archaeon]|nr:RDD family protein [Euryarchaeota archaeon]